ncbi:hypothetical protein BTA51_24485 [Hahella sp. CCB-MM4]|uniref:DUF481 domain-containing protein n=1 Tax=Hahella sp. (strain CCB-MM4) TaxID=1926491 RepID=UPI000B9AFB53|nr:DUF481 domain-containing protein [Hahella sp. CCB-MM4]OZG70746.1 hypothetical protein BTA51_24485 [Hahella sp. CCB-MM4]
MRLVHTAVAGVLLAMSFCVCAQTGNWEGETELGVLVTSGNTRQTNVKGHVALKHDDAPWRNSADLRVIYTEAEGRTTAEKYRGELKTDYKYTDKKYWFMHETYANERFSGYDFEASATLGLGYRFWQSGKRSGLDVSAGGGYRFGKLESAQVNGSRNEHEAIVRLAGILDFELSESAVFRQKVSSEMGLEKEDVVTESETSLLTNITDSLSMKLSYYVKYRSDPPAGSETTNTETALTVLYVFL